MVPNMFLLGILVGALIIILFAMIYYLCDKYGKKQLLKSYQQGYSQAQKDCGIYLNTFNNLKVK